MRLYLRCQLWLLSVMMCDEAVHPLYRIQGVMKERVMIGRI